MASNQFLNPAFPALNQAFAAFQAITATPQGQGMSLKGSGANYNWINPSAPEDVSGIVSLRNQFIQSAVSTGRNVVFPNLPNTRNTGVVVQGGSVAASDSPVGGQTKILSQFGLPQTGQPSLVSGLHPLAIPVAYSDPVNPPVTDSGGFGGGGGGILGGLGDLFGGGSGGGSGGGLGGILQNPLALLVIGFILLEATKRR